MERSTLKAFVTVDGDMYILLALCYFTGSVCNFSKQPFILNGCCYIMHHLLEISEANKNVLTVIMLLSCLF